MIEEISAETEVRGMAGLISVIIPVYNMEKTVGKSIDSVRSQTWKNLEIVVVDDGSKDKSGEICDRMAAEDSRVRVIHQPNGGVSKARNVGLAAATGDYIAWLDSDDWMEPRALEILMNAIDESGACMSLCNYENVEYSGRREKRYEIRRNEVITGREALERLIRRQITQSLCFNLAPRRFYEGIRFPEGELFEDVRNSWHMYERSRRVAVINDTLLYNRLVRENSISHAKSLDMRTASCLAYLERQRDVDAIRPELESVFVRCNYGMLLLSLRSAVLRDSKEKFSEHRAGVRAVAAYFRERQEMALGNRPGLGRWMEFRCITSGTRLGFYLSRIVSLLRSSGTWLER